MVRWNVTAGVALVSGLIAWSGGAGRASLHHPNEPMAVPVSAQGVPEPLPFDEFSRRRALLTNALNPDRALVNPSDPTKKSERGELADRIANARKNPARTPEQSTALAVDLLRFGRPDEATGALAGQRRGFLPNVTLAHIAAAQGEWGQALEYLDIANGSVPKDPPAGLTPQQFAWQVRLNRGPLARLFQARWTEARDKESRRRDKLPERAPDDEVPDPLFPVDFTKVAGPALDPTEQAKLPPDALATVQQLLLWFPTDARLYWLLGELYAVRGEFATAQKVLDDCAWSLKLSNRKVLMQHREAVTKAAKEKGPVSLDEPLLAGDSKPGDEQQPQPNVPFSMGAVWVYFGVVGVVALFALVRALTKKKPDSRPRIG